MKAQLHSENEAEWPMLALVVERTNTDVVE